MSSLVIFSVPGDDEVERFPERKSYETSEARKSIRGYLGNIFIPCRGGNFLVLQLCAMGIWHGAHVAGGCMGCSWGVFRMQKLIFNSDVFPYFEKIIE